MEYSQRQRKHLWLYAFVCPAIDRFSRIVQKIAPPEEIFDSPPDALKKYVSEEAIAKMRAHNSESYIDAMLDKLRTRGIDFICRGDDDYPDSFEEVSDIIVPPEVIFLRGARELPGKRALGVVGTRSSTAEGERIAHDFAREFAEYDITTVTGMALGIDSAATQGALDGGGRVVGVLGCGVDVPYPADNQTLVKRMLDNGGTLMSEYLPGTQPNPFYFPIRNRVIAAMCKGSLIIQAPRRSGALNTATHALNCGRDVFVVPGSILDPKFAGSNALLSAGDKYSRTAFARVARTWGDMLTQGATTFWETEQGGWDFDRGGSLCHAWSAVPLYLYMAYALGVKPTQPGFAKYEVKPLISGMYELSGKIKLPDSSMLTIGE